MDSKLNHGGKREGSGRPLGSKNKTTKEMRDFLSILIQNEFESITEIFQELKGKEKLDYMVKLLPYVMSKVPQDNVKENIDKIDSFIGWDIAY
jgi:hypothetical protein